MAIVLAHDDLESLHFLREFLAAPELFVLHL